MKIGLMKNREGIEIRKKKNNLIKLNNSEISVK